MSLLTSYANGNSLISLFTDGSRTIEFEDELKLKAPTQVDIRVSTSCSFAETVCKEFCHESAVTKGVDCDYDKLKQVVSELLKGTELAIGCNRFTTELFSFCQWCTNEGYICNLTINQGHIKRDQKLLQEAINQKIIFGLGVSYRSTLPWNVPDFILNYEHTVFHIISGMDDFKDVEKLSEKGVSKVLLLGEKSFGNNKGKVDLNSLSHKQWYWWVSKLFNKFKVVAFDNLGLEQLNIKRFFTEDNWSTFYQNENSLYIDAANGVFRPSSRSEEYVNWRKVSIIDYFNAVRNSVN